MIRSTAQGNPYLSTWLMENIETLRGAKHQLVVEGYNRRTYKAQGPPGSAAWTQTLSQIKWIPTSYGLTHILHQYQYQYQYQNPSPYPFQSVSAIAHSE